MAFFFNRNYHNVFRQNQSEFEGVEIWLIFKFAFKAILHDIPL